MIRDVVRYVTSRGLTITVGILAGIAIARFGGPSLKGQYAAIVAAVALAASFSEFGARQALVTTVATTGWSPAMRSAYRWLLSITGFTTAFVAILLLSPGSFGGWAMHIAVAGYAILKATQSLQQGVLLGAGSIRTPPLAANVGAVVLLVLVVPIVSQDPTALSLAIALVGSASATVWIQRKSVGALRMPAEIATTEGELRVSVIRLLRRGAPFAMALFLTTVNLRADTVMLAILAPDHEVGLYSVAYNMSELVWVIPVALGPLVFARFAGIEELTTARVLECIQLVDRTILGSFCLGALLWIGVILWGEDLASILYGGEFAISGRIAVVLMFGVVAFVPFKISHIALVASGSVAVVIRVMALAASMNILLNYLLIPRWGAFGAAFASTLTYLLSGSYGHFVHWRRIRRVLLNESGVD